MKSTTLLTSLLASTALAQYDYTNQSSPFTLQILSSNTTLNASYLLPCHIGAGEESLCILEGQTPDANDVYRLNTSSTQTTYNATYGEPGQLTYDLHAIGNGNETVVESEALRLLVYQSSNVGFPGFGIGGQQFLISFDDKDLANVQSNYDDTVTPPTDFTSIRAYYRWYICQNNYEGYEYFNLNWVLGDKEPQNPTCQSVNVKRTFV